MQTARCARASIGERFNHRIAFGIDEFRNHGIGRRLRERRLHRSHYIGDAVSLFQQTFKVIQKNVAAGLADVEQPDGLAGQALESRRGSQMVTYPV